MRRSRCKVALGTAGLAAALLAAGDVARANSQQLSAGVEGAAFLLLPVGARATALGQTATADGGTSEAIFWNPAGLATVVRGEFAIHHYEAFFGSGDAVAIVVPSSSLGTFALSAYLVDYGDVPVTRAALGPEPVGQISSRNVALLASYATTVVGSFALGLNYKLVQFRVDCTGDCTDVPTATGTTHAVDMGVRFGGSAWGTPLMIGVSLKNLGFKLQVNNRAQADPLPTRIAFGVSATLVRPAPGAEGLDARVLADVQSAVGEGALQPVTTVGIESGVGSLLRLRGGYAFLNSAARGPSLGVGVQVGSVAFDLARRFFTGQQIGNTEPVHISFRVLF
jgi:hypothetical protein